MPEFADIYVLSKDRDQLTIARFLDAFIPLREESADEYEIPQYADSPQTVFKRADELIEYCCANQQEVHAIYWRAVGATEPAHAMVFFLPDEHIVFGISCEAEKTALAQNLFSRLKSHLHSDQGLLLYEQCPPETAAAFKDAVRKSAQTGNQNLP